MTMTTGMATAGMEIVPSGSFPMGSNEEQADPGQQPAVSAAEVRHERSARDRRGEADVRDMTRRWELQTAELLERSTGKSGCDRELPPREARGRNGQICLENRDERISAFFRSLPESESVLICEDGLQQMDDER
jgi:hypothetical protein